ncbi:MAG: hypothetical protein V9E99_03080 [Microthrixaceae bacterium]|jgi:PHD/YefM family antitoxin component YafN of YafNO toxin-antitoxin module|nr:hypothetical protein [Actinomycetota bacterium]MBP6728452.1 hypothetical protein [Microthrixaceae bacterium]HMS12928.1 hypothetical protein [Microthrixaceae bacterium]HMT24191.1 hypothetical protein [Microthrixaceae bacterium]HMT60808.1 hypothetical protein [Microthrixaceae bacterium]
MADTLRIPVSVAARKGVSAIAAEAAAHRVVLTNHGRPIAVVDSAERLDEDVRTLREAARLVTEAFADQAIDAHPAKLSIEEVCGRLGLDVETVRAKSVTRRYA